MCELTVFLNGEKISEYVIYAKVDGSKVLLKDVSGLFKEVPNCYIDGVDISRKLLILESNERDEKSP